MSQGRRSPPLVVRAVGVLRQTLLPGDLYARHGEAMQEALADLYREARRSRRRLDRARLMARELRSLLHTALRERLDRDVDPTRLRQRRPGAHGFHPSPRTDPPDPIRSLPVPERSALMLDDLKHDLGFGLRMLRRSPVFAAVAILTLALGIGANTAVFSVVNGVLLQPLPYQEPEELTLVWTNFGPDLPQNWVSGPEYAEMRELASAFQGIAGVYPGSVSVTGSGEPEQVPSALVSGTFFEVMGADARTGRLLGPGDDVQGPFNVVISDGYWQRRFGGDPDVVGTELTVNGGPATIVGVLEPGFDVMHPDASFPDRTDLWAPIVPAFGPYDQMSRGSHGMRVFARMAEGVTLQQARADMDGVAARMAELSPDYYAFEGWGLTVLSLHDDLVEDARPALLILMGSVAFVLLIACVNVANLMITRALTRERELAVRSALGAGRRRLVQQLFTESLLLAVLGAGLGLALAYWLVGALAAAAPESLPRVEAIGIDTSVLLFTLGVGILTALLFGLAPAGLALRRAPVDSLREGGRGSTSGAPGTRLRMALVVAEVALALVLLVGAGLMIRSFTKLLDADPGYRTDQVLTMRIQLPSGAYDADGQRLFWRQLEERVNGLGGVESAGLISHLPLSGSGQSGTTLVDRSDAVAIPEQFDIQWPFIEADRRWVSGNYMETVGTELLEGRLLNEADARDAAPVAVVDEEFVRRFWPDESALEHRVAISFSRDPETEEIVPAWRDIVGVVRHARHGRLSAVGREQVYVPVAQSPVNAMYLAVRTEGDPTAVTSAVRRQVTALDPEQPIADVRTMTDRLAASVAQPRFNTLLLAGFAAIALVLAAVGLYGVISYAVGQRTNEIGIRMALGAPAAGVRRMVLRQAMLLVGAGLAIGIAAAVGVTRLIERLLYSVSPTDPLTYLGVAAVLTVVAALACLVPATRATRVEPVTALREE